MRKKHIHEYDAYGNQLCCTPQEGKIYDSAGASDLLEDSCCSPRPQDTRQKPVTEKDMPVSGNVHSHDHGHVHDHGHEHEHAHHFEKSSVAQLFISPVFSLVLLLLALSFDHLLKPAWFSGYVRLGWYVLAYLPVGLPVMREMWYAILQREFFSEFTLMVIATLGAFLLGEYPEAVAVMLFYTVGELFQTLAVRRAKGNIQKLIDQRPDEVTVINEGVPGLVKAVEVAPGALVQLKPGERLALDGILVSDAASFNTSALTGESKPDTKYKNEPVLAGMINLQQLALIQVSTPYADSKFSRILELVQHAQSQKAPTELFIRRFARVYTPLVVLAAVLIVVIPYFLSKTDWQGLPVSMQQYDLHSWVYRALIFLVVSCPCALVISIPLGYFGGIGAASRHGILVKGGNFLDVLAQVQQVVVDKTGTLTEGVFRVSGVHLQPGYEESEILPLVNALESKSSHPVASAIHQYVGSPDYQLIPEAVEEVPGMGMIGQVAGKELLVGNFKLLDKANVPYTLPADDIAQTIIAIAIDRQYAGYLLIADEVRQDAHEAVNRLDRMGINVTMLSGDKAAVVSSVANKLQITNAYGDLLPADKVDRIRSLKGGGTKLAFVGDGVNDAPAVALSDVGIAMGGLGSDATIETADVVIQDDKPSKIPVAIAIGKKTRQIVIQNISLAFIVKGIVLLLGAGGIATMWEAVFADVGVALLAILNAVRIQRFAF